MPFISIPFLFLFLPISIAFHFLAARFGERARLCALIAVSFVFYAAWDVRAAILLGCSIAVNYSIGRLLEQAREDEHALQTNAFLAAGVVFNLGVLVIFRYADFLLGTIDAVSGTNFTVGKILVPLGILFFSCDQIAYLVDLRRGKRYATDFLRYAAFVSFFPRLVAGPLLRYGQIESQWQQRGPSAGDLAAGVTTFVIGLAKTALLAGAVAPFATAAFLAAGTGQKMELFTAWTGVFAFACQIYFDLSGYADMAIGLGLCFGLTLPVNFRSPYRAENIAAFWRRWNITLADFLRDYVYVSLGGNRRGQIRTAFNLVATMVLGGLWYGAGKMFVAWALLHTIYIYIHRAWRLLCARSPTLLQFDATTMARVIGVALTFIAVTLGWIVFRSADEATALNFLAGLSGQHGAVLPSGVAPALGPLLPLVQNIGIGFAPTELSELLRAWMSIVLCLGVIFLSPNTETLLSAWHTVSTPEDRSEQKRLPLKWLPLPFWSMILGALAFVCFISAGGANAYLHWWF